MGAKFGKTDKKHYLRSIIPLDQDSIIPLAHEDPNRHPCPSARWRRAGHGTNGRLQQTLALCTHGPHRPPCHPTESPRRRPAATVRPGEHAGCRHRPPHRERVPRAGLVRTPPCGLHSPARPSRPLGPPCCGAYRGRRSPQHRHGHHRQCGEGHRSPCRREVAPGLHRPGCRRGCAGHRLRPHPSQFLRHRAHRLAHPLLLGPALRRHLRQ